MSNIILCADDSKTMQTVAEITFRVSDYQYVGAVSAGEALDKARSQKPALILADAAMPDMDGYELCRAIKSEPALAGVPVIMMCGNSSAYDAARGAEVGADGHLSKPWDTQVLLDKVAEILQGAGAKSARAGAAKAVQPARPAVVPQPPILPATAAAQAAGAAARTSTMIGMPQVGLESERLKGRPSVPEVENAQPLSPPLPPRSVPQPAPTPQAAAQPAARPNPAAAARPPGAAIARVATAPASVAGKAAARSTTVGTPPAAAPTARAATPAPVPAAARAPALGVAGAPAATRAATPAARPAAATARAASVEDPSAAAIGRPPMIKGTPTRQPTGGRAAGVAAQMQAAVPRAAAAVAREAGLDPAGPEMRALLALSKDVVERIVWEVVPDLAEAIIRENLEQLAAKR